MVWPFGAAQGISLGGFHVKTAGEAVEVDELVVATNAFRSLKFGRKPIKEQAEKQDFVKADNPEKGERKNA